MSDHASKTIHFESASEVRDFIRDHIDEYRPVAEQYDPYEAATAVRGDYDLCPWSIATQFDSPVPFDELAGPGPTDAVDHLATLCIEELILELLNEES